MPRDSYSEIGELLRSHKPDPRPGPGLEARIMQSLRPVEPAATSRFWPWLLLPPAVAAGMVLMWPQPAPLPAVTQQVPAPPVAAAPPAVLGDNPLERESLALRNDARRASRFLIDCLPGLDTPVQ
jgi:hypothetical protein